MRRSVPLLTFLLLSGLLRAQPSPRQADDGPTYDPRPPASRVKIYPRRDAELDRGGIRRLDHVRYPWIDRAADDAPDLIVVRPGERTVLTGLLDETNISHDSLFEIRCLFGIEGTDVPYDSAARWLTAGENLNVVARFPAAVEGMVVAPIAPRSMGESERFVPSPVIACGEAGRAHYALFRERYVTWRKTHGWTIENIGEGDSLRVADIEVEPTVIYTNDLDGDGRYEIVFASYCHFMNPFGEVLITRDEIGILFTEPGREPIVQMGGVFTEGVPRLGLIPPSRTGGEPIIFAVGACCEAVIAEAYRVRHDALEYIGGATLMSPKEIFLDLTDPAMPRFLGEESLQEIETVR